MEIAALTFVSLALAAMPAQSPYAGEEARAIKALSEADVKALLEGTGMGFAKPAELNQYPGPRHVLDNAEALELSETQRTAIEASYERMKSEAVPLGRQIVDVERRLDALFAERRANTPAVTRLTSEAAELQGRLRAVHLRAHVEVRDLLSATQIQKYGTLRGYGQGAHQGHQGQ
jgi:hypothetical protein